MAIIDCTTYNGEKELFELRYNILKDYVDEFRVVEFDKTFSGREKDWLFDNPDDTKIVYYQVREEDYEKYRELAENSPNTIGADHWKREFMQKESIKDCLTDLKDDDIVFIGDCDEIWNPQHLAFFKSAYKPEKIKLQVYTYYLNNRSSEEFWGTLVTKYKNIKNDCLNHLRTNAKKPLGKYGWHFTSLKDTLKQKLLDSYTEETYANQSILDNLDANIKNNKDFLGRDFQFTISEDEWPQYLKDNKERYKHLIMF